MKGFMVIGTESNALEGERIIWKLETDKGEEVEIKLTANQLQRLYMSSMAMISGE